MSEQDNLGIVQKGIDAWNGHDVDRYISILDDEHVWESDTLPESLQGHEGARLAFQMYMKAFPDIHFDVEQLMASGDHVVYRWRTSGTHKGELAGIPPTNRQIEVHGCTVNEIKNGKLIRSWVYWDTGHMMRQMGVLPGSS